MAGTGTWDKDTIKGEMHALWLDLVRGTDRPDLIIMTHDVYTAYWESLTDLQRYGNDKSAGANITDLKFQSADVIHDIDADNFTATGEKAYFINTNYLELVEHPEASWNKLEGKVSVNQDAEVIPLIWMGQMTCSNRAQQGVLIDVS
jgi:hypothetical protein